MQLVYQVGYITSGVTFLLYKPSILKQHVVWFTSGLVVFLFSIDTRLEHTWNRVGTGLEQV